MISEWLRSIFGSSRKVKPEQESAQNPLGQENPNDQVREASVSGSQENSELQSKVDVRQLSKNTSTSSSLREQSKPRRLQIVLGIDFGSAFTKVVIGETRARYAVSFQEPANGIGSYLLPGKLLIAKDGTCSLTFQPVLDGSHQRQGDQEERTDLKIHLLERDFGERSQIDACAYLALVIRYSRNWLEETHGNYFQDRELDWFINIGLPTDNWHDNELTEVYRKITKAAWALACIPVPISVNQVRLILFNRSAIRAIDDYYIHPDKIGVFPEFAAQIAGYVKSPLRKHDLHALIDVGAGTLDVTVFNVWEQEGDDLFPIFAKDVASLGVYYLNQNRVDESKYQGSWRPDPFAEASNDEEVAKLLNISPRGLQEIDKPFCSKVRSLITEQLKYTKKERYPESRRWASGIPTFLCGGGSRLQMYANIFEELESAKPPCKITLARLPKPESLQAPSVTDADFDRLSVAYGLSLSQFDIGIVKPHDEINSVDSESQGRVGWRAGAEICDVCYGSGGVHGPCYKCGGTGWM